MALFNMIIIYNRPFSVGLFILRWYMDAMNPLWICHHFVFISFSTMDVVFFLRIMLKSVFTFFCRIFGCFVWCWINFTFCDWISSLENLPFLKDFGFYIHQPNLSKIGNSWLDCKHLFMLLFDSSCPVNSFAVKMLRKIAYLLVGNLPNYF